MYKAFLKKYSFELGISLIGFGMIAVHPENYKIWCTIIVLNAGLMVMKSGDSND